MKLIKSKTYPEGYTYRGKAYFSEVEFHLVRVPYVETWVADKLISAFENGIIRGGGVPLKLEVYKDKHTLYTKYFVRVYYYKIPTLEITTGTIIGICITFALAVLGLYIIYKNINKFEEIVWGKEGERRWFAYLLAGSIGLFALGYVLRGLPKE